MARHQPGGLSLGGLVGTNFLALHPDCVTSLAAAASAIHNAPDCAAETQEQTAARQRKETLDKQAGVAAFTKTDVDPYKRQWLATHTEPLRPAVWSMVLDWPAWQPSHIESSVLLDEPVAAMIAVEKPAAPVLTIKSVYDSDGGHDSSDAPLKVAPHARSDNRRRRTPLQYGKPRNLPRDPKHASPSLAVDP